ncbi:hypothetical protein [Anaerocaecibacter muris]|uniref:hypothetical protein n=1 Tax=Anaerocaecibacter muris TaxID=2941513 RepID=UPI003F691C3C
MQKAQPIVLFRSANESLFALQYGCSAHTRAWAMNVIGVVRNIVFTNWSSAKEHSARAHSVRRGIRSFCSGHLGGV